MSDNIAGPDVNSVWNWIVGGVVAFLSFLLVSVWRFKPDRDEMTTAIRAAIEAFAVADEKADELRLNALKEEIKALRQSQSERHQDNVSRFENLDEKVERLLDYLIPPRGH